VQAVQALARGAAAHAEALDQAHEDDLRGAGERGSVGGREGQRVLGSWGRPAGRAGAGGVVRVMPAAAQG
jgi:hypothetical protein